MSAERSVHLSENPLLLEKCVNIPLPRFRIINVSGHIADNGTSIEEVSDEDRGRYELYQYISVVGLLDVLTP
jgi:hypothetical protein